MSPAGPSVPDEILPQELRSQKGDASATAATPARRRGAADRRAILRHAEGHHVRPPGLQQHDGWRRSAGTAGSWSSVSALGARAAVHSQGPGIDPQLGQRAARCTTAIDVVGVTNRKATSWSSSRWRGLASEQRFARSTPAGRGAITQKMPAHHSLKA